MINGVQSKPSQLDEGVPQGSVLGPLCSTMYTVKLEDYICSDSFFDDIDLMVYADDTQNYLHFC